WCISALGLSLLEFVELMNLTQNVDNSELEVMAMTLACFGLYLINLVLTFFVFSSNAVALLLQAWTLTAASTILDVLVVARAVSLAWWLKLMWTEILLFSTFLILCIQVPAVLRQITRGAPPGAVRTQGVDDVRFVHF